MKPQVEIPLGVSKAGIITATQQIDVGNEMWYCAEPATIDSIQGAEVTLLLEDGTMINTDPSADPCWNAETEEDYERKASVNAAKSDSTEVTFDSLRRAFPKLSADDAERLIDDIGDAEHPAEVEATLLFADRLLGGLGVEGMRAEGVALGQPYDDQVARYVNMGEDGNQTLLFSTEEGRWYLTTHADYSASWDGSEASVKTANESVIVNTESGQLIVELYDQQGHCEDRPAYDVEEAELIQQEWEAEGLPAIEEPQPILEFEGGVKEDNVKKNAIIYQGAVYRLAAGDVSDVAIEEAISPTINAYLDSNFKDVLDNAESSSYRIFDNNVTGWINVIVEVVREATQRGDDDTSSLDYYAMAYEVALDLFKMGAEPSVKEIAADLRDLEESVMDAAFTAAEASRTAQNSDED